VPTPVELSDQDDPMQTIRTDWRGGRLWLSAFALVGWCLQLLRSFSSTTTKSCRSVVAELASLLMVLYIYTKFKTKPIIYFYNTIFNYCTHIN